MIFVISRKTFHLIVDYYRYILWTMILYLYGSKRNQTDAWAWMDWHISILIDVINVGMCSNIAFRFLARNLACRNNDEIWFLYRNMYSRNRRMSQNAYIFIHHQCIGENYTFFMYENIFMSRYSCFILWQIRIIHLIYRHL